MDKTLKGILLGSLAFIIVYSMQLMSPRSPKESRGSRNGYGENFELYKELSYYEEDYGTSPYRQRDNRTEVINVGEFPPNITTLLSDRNNNAGSKEIIGNVSMDVLDPHTYDIRKLDPELFRKFPKRFDERYKNPCWYEKSRLRCIPYFYLIGMPKCGTTDLWSKLVQHPQIQGTPKEPHWWSKRRLGWTGLPIHGREVVKIRKMTGAGNDAPFEWYLNWFSTFGVNSIQQNRDKVLGDGSVTTSWDIGENWMTLYPEATEPPFVMADLLHEFQPNAKIVVILREPVSRQYSSYLYCHGKNADDFHRQTMKHLECHADCESKHSLRYCAYAITQCKLFRGMYYYFLRDWIEAYGREKIHVVMLSEWMSDSVNQYKMLSEFLNLNTPSDEIIQRIVSRGVQNSQTEKKKKRAGVIRPDTKKMLQDFYRPLNHKLAELLNDTRFLWDY
ncbi:carbohydrate sulfotransferase 15-like isoform X2 [Apostichopus japonicus]|uniref:carbohydrate sulfotransferase 15-like isoform X2 n=1 Tax=Stichopus japonicus TaxID=307972 RepID=UPI003AB4525E